MINLQAMTSLSLNVSSILPILAFSRPDDVEKVVFPFNDHTYNDLTTATISSSWDGLEIDGNAARLAVPVQVGPRHAKP